MAGSSSNGDMPLCSASKGLQSSYARSRRITLVKDNAWQMTRREPGVSEEWTHRSNFHLRRRQCTEAMAVVMRKAEHKASFGARRNLLLKLP